MLPMWSVALVFSGWALLSSGYDLGLPMIFFGLLAGVAVQGLRYIEDDPDTSTTDGGYTSPQKVQSK